MHRIQSLILSMLFASLVVADEPSVDELVQRLGDGQYKVREDATKALIARADKAIPALEKALRSEDVEVRMRAGRALRTIRERQAAQAQPAESKATPRKLVPAGVTSHSIAFANGQWTVTITKAGQTKTYKGKSLDEIKKKHPEVREVIDGSRFQFGLGGAGGRDPFKGAFKDFEKFFNDDFFKRNRGLDAWKRADGDLKAEIARLNQWAKWLAAQEQRRRAQRGQLERGAAGTGVPTLGVRARRPESVLDAQLGLRGRGLVIEEILRGTPAARLGLHRFDILLELNGVAIRTSADIGPALRRQVANKPLHAKVMRRANLIEITEPIRAEKKAPAPR